MYDHPCYNLINGLETPTLKILIVDRRGEYISDQTSTNLHVLQNHLKVTPARFLALFQEWSWGGTHERAVLARKQVMLMLLAQPWLQFRIT